MSTSPDGSVVVSHPAEQPAAAERDLIQGLGLPLSTYRACVRLGQGPRRFKIGRRVDVLKTDWHAWLEGLAESGGAHGLDPRGRD
jgi:hypothetical protein